MSKTSRSLAQLNELFHCYVAHELTQSERNTNAYANEVYDITDASGQQYVMRILKKQLSDSVNWEGTIQARLNSNGIRTPRYIQFADGGYVGRHKNLMFTLSRRIDGTTPTSISRALVTDFGQSLAKIHACLEGMTVPVSTMQWFNRQSAAHNVASYSGIYKRRLSMLYDAGNQIFDTGLPTTVIHGDFWSGNVFADANAITAVFDFETAEDTVRIIDLARTYTSMRRMTRFSPRQNIELLCEGYDRAAKTPLTAVEKENFHYAIAYVSGVVATWHALNGTEYTQPYIEIGEDVMATG